MRQIFAIAVVAFSAAAIASGQEQGAIRDPKSIAEQVIRKLDKRTHTSTDPRGCGGARTDLR